MPVGPPTALSSEFTADAQKQAQWTALSGRTGLTLDTSLDSVAEVPSPLPAAAGRGRGARLRI